MSDPVSNGERDFDHLLAELEACRGEILRLRGERDACAEQLVRWAVVATGLADEMRKVGAGLARVPLLRLSQTVLAAPSLAEFDDLVRRSGGREGST